MFSKFLIVLQAALVLGGGVSRHSLGQRSECVVTANGNKKDDVPNILQAFKDCGNGGTVVFPEDQNYWIATRLNPVVNDVTVEWRGQWTVRMPNS
jgi:galacturan 1,4-alpha-galacturonidase